jgi:hypothetical protein
MKNRTRNRIALWVVVFNLSFCAMANSQTYFFDKNANGYIDDEEILLLYAYWIEHRPLPPIECPPAATSTPIPKPTDTRIPTPPPTNTATSTPTRTDTPQPTATPAERAEELVVEISGLPQGVKPLAMKKIPAGTFMMGSPDNEQDRYKYEVPQHQVTISKPFYMGKYEVTQAQWQAGMNSDPSYFSGKPNHPVEQVSWDDCQSFIKRLNQMG